jgi:hypothetical protein
LLDWDSDGAIDLLGGLNSIVAVYLNPGTGEFPTVSSSSASVRCRTLRFADFDNDGDFDVLVSNIGTSGFSGQTALFRNPWRLSQPAPPQSLTSEADGSSVLLRWPAVAPLNGAPVTYNVRVGTAPGRGDILSPLSRSDGRRLVPAPGNAGFANSLRLRTLPVGVYYWSVQAVDVRWHGQSWAVESSFAISTAQEIRVLSLQLLSPTQVHLSFQAGAGRNIGIETSDNLKNWVEQMAVTIGLSGIGQADIYSNTNHNFFRLKVKP